MPKDKKVTRKLSAILSADVKGYSLLMADDEVHTIETLKAYRHIISDLVSKHSGRVVDSPGDNILAEFRSSVDAVECAVKIQKKLDQENSKFIDDKKVQFRIGVNVGDVIQDGDRIYGNGVNVAARIEALADQGGVCISRNAYDHVSSKLTLGYEYLGEHSVKNIKHPVRVYKLLMADEDAGKLVGVKPRPLVKKWIWAAIVVVAVIITSAVILVYQNVSKPEFEPAKVEEMAYPLPEKPSIAVLPFVNMSNDPDQEYFSDGITEDLITDLSQISGLFVISRNSTYFYKDKPIKIRQVAEDLGVRYVLEGSVRWAGNTVRINAQLIDAMTGGHIWAERYDEQIDNLFSLQDKITRNIVEKLAIKLTIEELQAIPKRKSDNLEAYLIFLKGWQYYRQYNPVSFAKAISLFEEAIELDPEYYHAYAALSAIYRTVSRRYKWREPLGINKKDAIKQAKQNNKKAMKDPTALAHAIASRLYHDGIHFQEAIDEARKAISHDPNDPEANNAMGWSLLYIGKHKESIAFFKKAKRLDPLYHNPLGLGTAYLLISEYEIAATLLEKAYSKFPEDSGPLWSLPAAYAYLGQQKEAEATLARLLDYYPSASMVSVYSVWRTLKNPKDSKLIAVGMRKAGMR